MYVVSDSKDAAAVMQENTIQNIAKSVRAKAMAEAWVDTNTRT
jgi:hypothetical protein